MRIHLQTSRQQQFTVRHMMKSKTSVFLGAVLATIIAGVALPSKSEKREPEPKSERAPAKFIYLLDARHDPSRALPVVTQLKRNDVKVILRTANSLNPPTDYRALFEEFHRTHDADRPSPMFFMLDRPYGDSMMALRMAVENREHRDMRAKLMNRLVVVRDTKDLGKSGECVQLRDGIIYATDNFLGIGLIIHDDTVPELKKCVDALFPAG
jgi:hypothetical protein